MMQMQTKHKIRHGGLPLAQLLTGPKMGSSHQKTVCSSFYFIHLLFHYFHNDWNGHHDHVIIIMKETHCDSAPFGTSEPTFCCLIGKSLLILQGDQGPLVSVGIIIS